MTIPVKVLLDGQQVATLNAPWHPNGVTPVASSISNIAPGSHTVTIQHADSVEYYNETVFSHSVFHDGGLFGSDWWDYYYNVYHYWTAACSDTESIAVLPAYEISPTSGPYAGGNTLTITNGNFGTVTNVIIGGLAATITGSGNDWVTFTVPALGSSGVKDVVVQTSDHGDLTLTAAYTVNTAGVIGSNQQAAIAGGLYHSLGLKSDGSIVAWGNNDNGQTNVSLPNTDFVAVAAGADHSLGLKTNGSILAWGRNDYGQTTVPEPNTSFVALAGGWDHSLGLKIDGSIVAWGGNYDGQTNVPSPNTGFVAVAAGFYHCLGLKSDGSIVAWGDNGQGQANVPSPNTGFVAVAAGYFHSLGLKSDGSIVAWGGNSQGQTAVPSPNTDFVAVAAGSDHSLGLKSDGSIFAWGFNLYGQSNVPVPNTGFVAVHAGYLHSLGLKSDGSIVAWGNISSGQATVPAPNANYGLSDGVSPNAGSRLGGYEVVISGANLGNGSDITNVTLCGVPATIVSQTSTQVVVTAGTGAPSIGNVVVSSTSYGMTTKTSGFSYQKTDQTIAFPAIGDKLTTETVELSATASSGLPVSFSVRTGPAVISGGTHLTFTGAGTVSIVASQAGDTNWSAATDVTNTFNVVPGSPVIGVSGNLAFGNVAIGATATATMTIANSGNAPLTVTGITYPAGFSGAWSGTIAVGGSHEVTVTFAPVAVTAYSGTVTVASDAASGTNTLSASGTGTPGLAKAITGFSLATANSGNLINGPAWVTGRYGNGLSLSNGKYVTVPAPSPDHFNITGDLTLALWIKPNSVTCTGADPAYALISKRSSNRATPYELFITNGGGLILHYYGSNVQYPNFVFSGTVSAGVWQHVAVTRSFSGSTATVTFYINGIEAGSSTAATGPALGSPDPVWISRDGYHTGYTNQGSYSGLMDEVQIYNRALSGAEIARIHSHNDACMAGRVGNWRFDETSGSTAFGTLANGVINEQNKTVTAVVPDGTNVTALTPRVEVSPNTTVSPLSGAVQNFSSPVLYTVTAEDLSTQGYIVTVLECSSLADGDGNGLPDTWEALNFGATGINPSAICANGSNTVNEAYVIGLDPNDPASRFLLSVEPVAGQPSQKRLVFSPCFTDRTYTILTGTTLEAGLWTELTGGIPSGEGNERSVIDPNAVENRKFYRMQINKQ